MNHLKFSLYAFLILTILACNEETNDILATCDRLCGANILAEEEESCEHLEVYMLDGRIYTRCYCCSCLKASPILNCEGIAFKCSDTIERSECREQFFQTAEFLFRVTN